MVDEVAGDYDTAWVYRGDERIRRPWATLTGPASQPARPSYRDAFPIIVGWTALGNHPVNALADPFYGDLRPKDGTM